MSAAPVSAASAVGEAPAAVPEAALPPAGEPRPTHRLRYWGLLALVLAGALVLRLWGIKQGLPYVYNTDENSHFVPKAIGMLDAGNLAPPSHYFGNPPGFTYVLRLVLAVWFGGRSGVDHAYAAHPTDVYVVARATAAILGAVSIWLLYLAGSRMLDRRVGVLAAALMSVAFLPVFYSHLALNDVPTLAPLTLSLVGTAGILRYGRPIDYLVAGVGLGLACATKYTAGIVLFPLLAATAVQFLAPGGKSSAMVGIVLAAVTAAAAFFLANPYAVLDYSHFRDGITHQSTVSEEAGGKLGSPTGGGLAYYMWTFTWGLGWVPALAALGGAVALWFDERRLVFVMVPMPLLFLAFMGIQGRYFGRWLLPIFPIVCLLAAYFALELADRAAARRPMLRPTLVALAAVALCAQGLLYSIHSGLVLSRADTRNQARDWMVAHVPAGARVVVEPVVPNDWATDIAHPLPQTPNGRRWLKYTSLHAVIDRNGKVDPIHSAHNVYIEDYERTLSPGLIPYYEQQGFCWVVSGSTQAGRAQAAPKQVPLAIEYYRALAAQGQVVYHASPYQSGKGPVSFNFDWTFDYYPLAYMRPGPEMTVYRLTGGRCGSVPAGQAPAAPTVAAAAGTGHA